MFVLCRLAYTVYFQIQEHPLGLRGNGGTSGMYYHAPLTYSVLNNHVFF